MTIPVGTVSDGASIPRILWPLLGGPWGRAEVATWVHDYIYSKHRTDFTKAEADQIMFEIMKRAGTPRFKARVIYWGLRIAFWKNRGFKRG